MDMFPAFVIVPKCLKIGVYSCEFVKTSVNIRGQSKIHSLLHAAFCLTHGAG